METNTQKLGWIFQLWSIARDSIDKEEREAAEMLLRALKIEFERIKRIRELAQLLLDYQLTSPSPFYRWRFCLCQKLYFLKTGY